MTIDIDNIQDIRHNEPEEGHTLLLMEAVKDQCTFSDYPSLLTCLDTISGLYETHREQDGLVKDNYTLKDLTEWMDKFHKIEVFVYNREIMRYKRSDRIELKEIFLDQLSKLSDADE